MSHTEENSKDDLRFLWISHCTHMKEFIKSASIDSSEVDTILLLQNQDNIANHIVKYTGSREGFYLSLLIRGYVIALGRSILEMKNTNKEVLDIRVKNTFHSSNQLAKYLSSLNPAAINYENVLTLLNDNINIALVILTYPSSEIEDITLFDIYNENILLISDCINCALYLPHNCYTGVDWVFLIVSIIIIVMCSFVCFKLISTSYYLNKPHTVIN
jgi:hypothetical protein